MRSPPARYSVTKTELRGDSKRPTWGLEDLLSLSSLSSLSSSTQRGRPAGRRRRTGSTIEELQPRDELYVSPTAWEMYLHYKTFREGILHLAQVFGGSTLSRLPLSDKINASKGPRPNLDHTLVQLLVHLNFTPLGSQAWLLASG